MRYYLALGPRALGIGPTGIGHWANRALARAGHWPAQGMGKKARAGHWGHTSPRDRTAITQVWAGAGLLKFLVCIRDFDEPAPR
jgi:hypothetical protein